jgi:hypothetical protein
MGPKHNTIGHSTERGGREACELVVGVEALSVITSDGRRSRNDGESVRTVLRDKFVVAVDEDAPDSDVIVCAAERQFAHFSRIRFSAR